MSKRLYKQASDTGSMLPTGTSALPLERPVAVYYRQSTEAQVGNISTTIQTVDMVEELVRRGWDRSLVLLIDMDQGVSGTTRIDEREGMRTLFSLISERKIGAVACQDEDRLFRDVTQIQVNIFIEACRATNVLVLTPSMVYDFANEFVGTFHARQFRFKSEMAAEYINAVIKGKLQKAKRRLLLEGRWGGAGLPPGYMIDTRRTLPNGEKNEAWRRFVPFEPYASVVREYFRLFLFFNGHLRTTFRHIQEHGPWYPDPATCPPPAGFRVVYKMHRYECGFCPGRVGLRQLLTNASYLGHWIYNDVVVQWNNHEPLIDEDTFFRAYNYLCPVLLDGSANKAYNPVQEHARPSLDVDRGQERPLLSGLLVAFDGSAWRNFGTRWSATNNHYVYELRTQRDFNEYEWSRAAMHLDERVVGMLRAKLNATFDTKVWQRTLAQFSDAVARERKTRVAQLTALDQVMKNLLTNLDQLSNGDMIRAAEKRYVAAQNERDRLLGEIALLNQENQSAAAIQALQVNSAPALENWPNLSREQKQSVIHAFVRNIEVTRVEKFALSVTINWRDDSQDQFLYASPNANSTVWLQTEIEQLLDLVKQRTPALDVAAAFPTRTWGAISQKARQTCSPSHLRIPFGTLQRHETYAEYAVRVAESASPVRVLKHVPGRTARVRTTDIGGVATAARRPGRDDLAREGHVDVPGQLHACGEHEPLPLWLCQRPEPRVHVRPGRDRQISEAALRAVARPHRHPHRRPAGRVREAGRHADRRAVGNDPRPGRGRARASATALRGGAVPVQRRHATRRPASSRAARRSRVGRDEGRHEPARALGPRLPPRAQAGAHHRGSRGRRRHHGGASGRGAAIPAEGDGLTMRPGGRRSVRCAKWDYTSPGAYYITLNTHRFQPIFARAVLREKRLTLRGILATACWLAIPSHFSHVRLDEFTVMPNHFHGVLVLLEEPRWFALEPSWALPREPRLVSGSVGAIVGSFKSAVTRLVHRAAPNELTRAAAVWHRGYHDRIIRDEREFDAKRRYTINNWGRWVDEHLP